MFEHVKHEASLWFVMGRWVPGLMQDLLPTNACFHSVGAFTEVNGDGMYPVHAHDCKQLVASLRGRASCSGVMAELDTKANILESHLSEKGAVPFLKMI
jgi:hypothetical protein